MVRKRLTQVFPALIPVSRFEKNLVFNSKLFVSKLKNKYCDEILDEFLKYNVYLDKSELVNENSGFDIKYQINKIDNLKIASKNINRILIKPNEFFSFWNLVGNVNINRGYKEGLCSINGKIIPVIGGGLCQLSNLLFWVFLHTPLSVITRHGHGSQEFEYPDANIPFGTDAAVSEGLQDLVMKNETDSTFQIVISFDEKYMYCQILSDKDIKFKYEVESKNEKYFKANNVIYHCNQIYQKIIDKNTNKLISEKLMYNNKSIIKYKLNDDIKVIEEE